MNELAVAEMKRYDILIRTSIREALRNCDLETARIYYAQLSALADYAQRAMIEIGRPDRWLLYCQYCNFEHPPMFNAKKTCPRCGDKMKIWDLSMGKRQRK